MRRLLMTLVAVAVILVPASAAGDTFRFRAGGEPGDFKWRPRARTIERGDRVVWRNPSDFNHTVTAFSNNWSKNVMLAPGDRTSKKFRRRGTYRFRCIIGDGTANAHSTLSGGVCSGMCGKVRVVRPR